MINNEKLYQDLMLLCTSGDTFYYSDFECTSQKYRIFDYRLASYTDFCKPSALACRGIMFQIDDNDNYIRLASRPMDKFFNYAENPFTIMDKNIPVSEIEFCIDKMDGSLISSFMNGDCLVQFKSKGSLYSEHALLANEIIKTDLKRQNEITVLEALGYTCNFELLSPKLRIVVFYKENELRFLNARNKNTGEYLTLDDLKTNYPALYKTSVYTNGYFSKDIVLKNTVHETVEHVYGMLDNIEGFIFKLKNGTFFKVKTNKYCSLHHSKDSILIESRLFNVVLDGGSDDLRQLFKDDEDSINRIKNMEQKVFMSYNTIIGTVTEFHAAFKTLDRKEYAAKVISELPKEYNMQGLAFMLYQGRTPDYKENLRKYMKVLIKED